jgi:hypothetical protein
MKNDRAALLKHQAEELDAEVIAATKIPPPIEDPALEPAQAPATGSPGEPPGAGSAPIDPPALTPEEETRAGIDMLVMIAVPFYPSLDQVYTPEVRDRLARTLTPVLSKYGISIPGLFGRWKEEIDFAFIAVPVAIATARAVKLENAARAAAKKAPAAPAQEIGNEGSSTPAPGAGSSEPLVSIG